MLSMVVRKILRIMQRMLKNHVIILVSADYGHSMHCVIGGVVEF